MDWLDIAEHTVPTMAVGVAMGFMGAFGYASPSSFEMWLWLAPSLLGAIGFTLLWARREQRQHGGQMGGTQSKLEGLVPIGAGVVSYVASFLAFTHWPV